VRPLLRKNRAELRSYLADTGVAFREDRSNQSNEPLRNRLRNRILPLLEAEVNPQVREALMRLGEQAHWLAAFLGETVERTFETLIVTRTDRVLVLNAEAMGRKSRIVQTELVRTAYRSFGLGEQELSFAHMVSALDLIADPAGGKQVQLPGGLIMEKRYGQISFALESDEPREMLADEVTVRLPGVTVLPMRKLEIVCEPVDVEAGAIPALREAAHRMQEYVDLDSVRPPLTVRKRRSGERFFPLGAPGTKKLSDFLNEAKIAPVDRDHVAVLCDQLGPIWVIGLRIDDRVKLTSQTRRVLRLFAQRITD
jgi:tRNA(Ile)-lysidine synthase